MKNFRDRGTRSGGWPCFLPDWETLAIYWWMIWHCHITWSVMVSDWARSCKKSSILDISLGLVWTNLQLFLHLGEFLHNTFLLPFLNITHSIDRRGLREWHETYEAPPHPTNLPGHGVHLVASLLQLRSHPGHLPQQPPVLRLCFLP